MIALQEYKGPRRLARDLEADSRYILFFILFFHDVVAHGVSSKGA
jgi:hypothetical protein